MAYHVKMGEPSIWRVHSQLVLRHAHILHDHNSALLGANLVPAGDWVLDGPCQAMGAVHMEVGYPLPDVSILTDLLLQEQDCIRITSAVAPDNQFQTLTFEMHSTNCTAGAC
jgi:hypothetical protein